MTELSYAQILAGITEDNIEQEPPMPNNQLAEKLRELPDINHARIQFVKDREQEFIIGKALRDQILASLPPDPAPRVKAVEHIAITAFKEIEALCGTARQALPQPRKAGEVARKARGVLLAALPPSPASAPEEVERVALVDAILEETAKVLDNLYGGQSSQSWNEGFARAVRDMKSTGRTPKQFAALSLPQRGEREAVGKAMIGACVARRSNENGGDIVISFAEPDESWGLFRLLSNAFVEADTGGGNGG